MKLAIAVGLVLAGCGGDGAPGPATPGVRCAPDGEPVDLGRLPAGSLSVDLEWTGSGWVVVAGLDYAQRLWTFSVDGTTGEVTAANEALGLETVDATVSYSTEDGIGLVVFSQGMRWIDAEGRPAGPLIATTDFTHSLAGAAAPLDGSFLYWSGGSRTGGELLERVLGRAVIPVGASEISVAVVPGVETARALPVFTQTTDALVGISIGQARDDAYVAWHDRAGNPIDTVVYDRRVEGSDGSIFAAAVAGDTVWLGLESYGPRGRRHVVDRLDRDGRVWIETDVLEDAAWLHLATVRGAAIAAWNREEGGAAVAALGGEPVAVEGGTIYAFEGDPEPALILHREYEAAHELRLQRVRCDSE